MKMAEFQANLISDHIKFDELSLVNWLLDGCEFAYEHYQDKDDFYDGYTHQFEVEISTLGLRLSSGLKKIYPNLKNSELVLNTIVKILDTPKYAGGRAGFIIALWENKLDDEFINIIETRKELWNYGRIAFNIVWGLTRRRIGGFSEDVNKVLAYCGNDKANSEIIKQCNKYLADEIKYKKRNK